MTDRVYWFARRFPVGSPRQGIAPVAWQGYAVAGVFLSGMIFSALAWMALAAVGLMVVGIVAFVIGAALSGAAFVAIARKTADMTHTVEDYRTGRASSAPDR
jgi:hypothetical protein